MRGPVLGTVLALALGAVPSAPSPAEGGLAATFPNGASFTVEGPDRTAHGRWVGDAGGLTFRGDAYEVRYDLEVLEVSPSAPDAGIEALFAARLGEAEAHRPDVGALGSWAGRMGATDLWIAQTRGGREVGRPPALAVVADLPGQRLVIVQTTFPWQESWEANADFVDLLRRARFIAGAGVGSASRDSDRERPAGVGAGRTDGGAEGPERFDPWTAGGPPATAGREVAVAIPGGGLVRFRAVPEAGWSPQPGGLDRREGPGRLAIRVLDLGAAHPGPAALAALGGQGTTRPLSGAPRGAEGAGWIAEVGGSPERPYRAVIAFVAAGRTVGLSVGPAEPERWRRWRKEVAAVLREVVVEGR